MTRPLNLPIAESEPEEARDARRDPTGRSSGETYVDALRALAPGARFDIHRPQEPGGLAQPLDAYDGVFPSGSPLHVYHDNHEVRTNVDFMRAVFDAPAVHGDEVETLPPDGATLLAGNAASPVQAAEIRHGAGTFWGVQYHPEPPLDDLAQAIRRQSDGLVARGLARSEADVEAQAALFEALGREPDRLDVVWRLGVDREVAEGNRRRTELRNALRHLVEPTRARRGRG